MLGFLNFHKPIGCTSHDCVAQIRRLLHTKKVGHGGTLDPAACGVLPLAVGQATRLLPYLPEDKTYRGRVRFGLKTTTDDLEGEVLETHPAHHLTQGDVEQILPEFLGTITQIPPRYSAIQVQGKRLYDLARSGECFEVPSRQVHIYRLTLLSWQINPYPEVEVEIHCGAGTYIRSLARDWGDRLGVGATLAGLVRTRSSGFVLEHSLTLAEISAQYDRGETPLLNPAIVLQHLPKVRLEDSEILPWSQGKKLGRWGDIDNPLDNQNIPNPDDYKITVYDQNDRFLGIAQYLKLDTPETMTDSVLSSEGVSSEEETVTPFLYYLAPKIVFNLD